MLASEHLFQKKAKNRNNKNTDGMKLGFSGVIRIINNWVVTMLYGIPKLCSKNNCYLLIDSLGKCSNDFLGVAKLC